MSSRGELALRQAQLWLAEEEAGHRVLSPSEREEIESLLALAQQELGHKSREPNLPPITGDLAAGAWSSTAGDGSGRLRWAVTPGEAFTASEAYKAISDPSRRSERWSTGLVEIGPSPSAYGQTKGTLFWGVQVSM